MPGSSPWYPQTPWAPIQTTGGQYTWETRKRHSRSGISCLLTPEKKIVLLLDPRCDFVPVPDDRLLAWRECRRGEDSSVEPPRIIFTLLSLNRLQACSDIKAAAHAFKSQQKIMAFEGGDPVLFELPTNVGEGAHPISPPKPFLDLPEVLCLADYGSEASNYFDKMFRAIFAFDFIASQVTVFPQRWFNHGNYDFMYQGITRVRREPLTGQIVGEGVRLGAFRLDRSATQIQ